MTGRVRLACFYLLGGLVVALVGASCSPPSIHGIAEEGPVELDESLLGRWTDSEDTTFVVTRGAEGRYAVEIQGTEEGEPSEPLAVEAALVRLGEHRVLDVRLADSERDTLAKRFVGMALSTHHFFLLRATDETLSLLSLDPDWLAGFPGYDAGAGDLGVLVADPVELRWLIGAALEEKSAWSEAFELTRIAAQP